ncbi:MAG TPA: 3'-5' exonuclease [Anaeromyxobacter sp.]|nr:3'-5' exonuclease [Anaeromyxobacter sp.]
MDLETTGLDPATDEIVSVGWVALTGERIDLSTAGRRLVLPTRAVPEESAVIHAITDDVAARGAPPPVVLAELLSALAGRVLVAHNAAFELEFLRRACARAFGGRFLSLAVDTLALGIRRLERQDPVVVRRELRLDALRRRHNLPRYRAHDALSDALAAAELFLAQLAHLGGDRGVRLSRVLLGR